MSMGSCRSWTVGWFSFVSLGTESDPDVLFSSTIWDIACDWFVSSTFSDFLICHKIYIILFGYALTWQRNLQYLGLLNWFLTYALHCAVFVAVLAQPVSFALDAISAAVLTPPLPFFSIQAFVSVLLLLVLGYPVH